MFRACVCSCTLVCACLCVRALCVCVGVKCAHVCGPLPAQSPCLAAPLPLPAYGPQTGTHTHSNCRGGVEAYNLSPLPCVLQAMCTRTAMCVYDSVPRVGCVGPVRVFALLCVRVCVFVPYAYVRGQVCICVWPSPRAKSLFSRPPSLPACGPCTDQHPLGLYEG